MDFGNQFLTEPALFPARLAGTRSGDADLTVEMPGGPYALEGLSDSQRAALRARYGERCLVGGQPDSAVGIQIFTGDPGEFRILDRRGWTNRYDFDYSERSVRIAGNQVMAQLRWCPRLTAALWTPLQEGGEFLEAFENCFRALVSYRLLDLGGAVLHSSGVVDGDRAWVFFGHSGAGKTTIARRSLAEGRTVLSDDINALFVEDSVSYVAKMPFAGELGRSNERVEPVRLVGLNRIEQAAAESWRPLTVAAAVASMLSCAPFLNRDPYRLPTLMTNLEALARGTTTGVLQFSLAGDFWSTLEGLSR